MQNITVTENATIIIPWVSNSRLGEEYVHVGGEYVLDAENEFYRYLCPNGTLRTWKNETLLILDLSGEDPDVALNWFSHTTPQGCKSLAFEEGAIYPDNLEGEENKYIKLFVEFLSDPKLNPLGFPLKDGDYKCPSLWESGFEMNFGIEGSEPSMVLFGEGAEETRLLNLPWEMYIAVLKKFKCKHPKNRDGNKIPKGGYTTKIRSWHNKTGVVDAIQIRGAGDFYMHEDKFLEAIITKKIQILEITVDVPRRY